MADFVIPIARAMFLCGHVADAGHGNIHLGWVFDTIRPVSYAHREELICVAVQLSDGSGDVPVSLDILKLPKDASEGPRRIAATEPELFHFANRLIVHRAILRLPGCVFPEPGHYLVELYCGDVCVADAPLRLHPAPMESN